MGIGLALALVVDEHRQRRAVDAREDRALGVVVVIGRGIAREPPHDIGRAPAELERSAGILRLGHHRQCAAHRLVDIGHRIEPEGDQRADALADFQGGEAFGRPFCLHRLIHRGDPRLDHRHRQSTLALALEGEPRDIWIAAGHLGSGVERGFVPAVEDGGGGDIRRERDAQLVQRHVGEIGGHGVHVRKKARTGALVPCRHACRRRPGRSA